MIHLRSGKGKKDRWCPLWEETAQVMMTLLEESMIAQQEQAVVFHNHLNKPLSRFGVDYILKKYGRLASDTQPGLKKKRLSPHTIRHTTAVHLLNSGVDINVIRGWLGHVDLATTNIYAEINQTTKMKALERCNPTSSVGNPEPPSWKKQEDILSWLESL